MSLDTAFKSLPLEPEEVKRREYFGISIFIVGLLSVIAGIIGLAFATQIGIGLLVLGAIATLTGPYLLTNIPIVAALPETSAT